MRKIDWDRYAGKRILIYGAHLVAVECCRYLVSLGMKRRLLGFAVTWQKDNPSLLEELPVREIQEYAGQAQETLVVIAMSLKFHSAVRERLSGLGFAHVEAVGLEELSQLKGQALIGAMADDGLELRESANDPTWLDVYSREGVVQFKFPTLFYLGMEKLKELVLLEAPRTLYQRQLGHLLPLCDLHEEEESPEDLPDRDFQIYMAYGLPQSALVKKSCYSPWIKPLLVGAQGQGGGSFFRDDAYEGNISCLNPLLAEMTGVHWIWKMAPASLYKGLCHYRRHFLLSGGDIAALGKQEIDVLLTLPRYVPGGIGNMFLAETPVKKPVLKSIFAVLEKNHAEDSNGFKVYLEESFYCPNNMVVARAEIYDGYCQWIFSILLGMLDEDKKTGYGHENDRHIAYAAELLTSYYFLKKMNGLRIAVADYKFYM